MIYYIVKRLEGLFTNPKSFIWQNIAWNILIKFEVLRDVINRGVQINYLMGYNEPYASHQEASSYANKADKGVSGTEGAEWWRLYIQPVAEALNLDLVSPTTGISKQKSGWLIEVINLTDFL